MIISRIADLVSDRSLTLSQLSRLTGISYKTIVKLYYADFSSIHIDTLDSLCTTLGTTPGEIFQHVPSKTSPQCPVVYTKPKTARKDNKRVGKIRLTKTVRRRNPKKEAD